MPGKFQEGFTKAAQKQKFIRHRDIKLKDKEVKKERTIQKGMCEVVCSRCRDKVQWRFKYDKYKPLKNPAKCQECKQKTVYKAYRTFCDHCSSKKKVCPSCCLSYDEIEAARLAEQALKKDSNNDDGGGTIDKLSVEMDEEEVNDDANEERDDDDDENEDEDNEMDADDDDNIVDNNVDDDDNEEAAPSVFTSMSNHKISFNIGNDEKIKDKYSAILETKYSKNRTIGNETNI